MWRARDKVLLLLLSAVIHCGLANQYVSLTISSLKRPLEAEGPAVVQRQVEMNWHPQLDANWLGLFDHSPLSSGTEALPALVRVAPSDYSAGFYRTNITFPRMAYPNGWNKGTGEKRVPGDVCMRFWIGAYKHNDLVHKDCIKIRPTWMGDHRDRLENLMLADLFIPGTHNSATYNRVLMESTGEVIGRYVLTQDTDVWGQLVHGIRYLDFHIRHYPGSKATSYVPVSREDDWFRKLVNVDAVTATLEDIKEYLEEANFEIVILDIHEFPPGFGGHRSNHHQLISLLESVLGDFILPFSNVSYESTLGEVWKTGRNLIVTYNNLEIVNEYDWLWGPVPHLWAEMQSREDLKEFLQTCFDEARTSNKIAFWAAMAELKPTPVDFMFGGAGSLRELASSVNRFLTKWFQNEWWKYANIVTTDFFLGNSLIDIAVKACLDKANNTFQAGL